MSVESAEEKLGIGIPIIDKMGAEILSTSRGQVKAKMPMASECQSCRYHVCGVFIHHGRVSWRRVVSGLS